MVNRENSSVFQSRLAASSAQLISCPYQGLVQDSDVAPQAIRRCTHWHKVEVGFFPVLDPDQLLREEWEMLGSAGGFNRIRGIIHFLFGHRLSSEAACAC